MKKFLSLVTAIVMTVSLCIMPVYAQTYEEAAADAQNAEINYNRSVPLEVKGNKIVKQGTDEMVVLRGVNVPSMDWGMAEHLFESMTMVYDSWGANLIRLPINPKYWKNGSIWDEKNLTKEQYQKYIDEIASKRKTMVSSGDRSAKIRTYNYPQGRVTDHRINLTLYNLSSIMDGEIQTIIDQLIVAENAERLKEAQL